MFHENLKRLREGKGLTQATFAAALGTPLRTVQGWEQGRREPKLDVLPRIADVLGVKVDELLTATATKKTRKRKGE